MLFPNGRTKQHRTGALTHMGFLVLIFGATGTTAAAAGAQTYPDGHGGEVRFPQGDESFADAVAHYDNGELGAGVDAWAETNTCSRSNNPKIATNQEEL